MPAAVNRQQPTHPTPGGGGLNQAGKSGRAGERGSGERKKNIPHLYRTSWDVTHLSPSNCKPGWASSQLIDIERKMREIKKIAPVAPKERKKQRSERGLTPHRPYRRRKQAIDREKPLEKNDQRTLDKARFKIYPITRTQSTDERQFTQSTYSSALVASLNRSKGSHTTQRHHPSALTGMGQIRRATMNPTPQAPRSPTRASGANKRDERGSEMKGEPQPAEQERAGTHMADRYERLDIAMAMNDITGQASRDGGPIKPRPASRYEPAGSKAGRDETQTAGDRNEGEKTIPVSAVLTSS